MDANGMFSDTAPGGGDGGATSAGSGNVAIMAGGAGSNGNSSGGDDTGGVMGLVVDPAAAASAAALFGGVVTATTAFMQRSEAAVLVSALDEEALRKLLIAIAAGEVVDVAMALREAQLTQPQVRPKRRRVSSRPPTAVTCDATETATVTTNTVTTTTTGALPRTPRPMRVSQGATGALAALRTPTSAMLIEDGSGALRPRAPRSPAHPQNLTLSVNPGDYVVSCVVLRHQGAQGQSTDVNKTDHFYYQARLTHVYPQKHLWSGWETRDRLPERILQEFIQKWPQLGPALGDATGTPPRSVSIIEPRTRVVVAVADQKLEHDNVIASGTLE